MSDIQDEPIQEPQVTAPPVYAPSADDIANAVAARFQQPQQAPQQRPFDAIEAAKARLQQDGWSETAISLVTTPAQALRIESQQQIHGAVNKAVMQVRQENQLARSKEVVDNVLSQYNDPGVTRAALAIRAAIETRAVQDPAFMRDWNRGMVNTEALIKHAKIETEDFLKTIGRSTEANAPAAPPMRTGGNNLVPLRSTPAAVSKAAVSEDSLEDYQLKFADDYESLARSKLGMSPVEARKAALERAVAILPRPALKGKTVR